MNILHITAHLGGGVGNILTSVALQDKVNRHKILTLEETHNTHFFDIAATHGVEIIAYDPQKIKCLLEQADVVQVEWWHNPLVAQLIIQELSDTKTRLVVWSHISGCNYPRTPFGFIKTADEFAFTSPFSYENPSFTAEDKAYIKAHCTVIPSSANSFDAQAKRREHDGFNIGYVGFLGYNKLNKAFVEYCTKVAKKLPQARFTIVGELSYGQELLGDINNSPISELFTIKGYSKDVANELATIDVFGYPLCADHTGTTENTLLEAMAAGAVPVVLGQCSEKYIVENGKTGFCVKDGDEYASAIRLLYDDKKLRLEFAAIGSDFVKKNYSLNSTVDKLQQLYTRQMENPKRLHDFKKVFGDTPYDWFLACYKGDLKRIDGLAMSKTKGSLVQFADCFVQDERLNALLKENLDGRN